MSSVIAQQLPEKDEDREEEEYLILLAAFKQLVEHIDADEIDESWQDLEDLMELRAAQALKYACEGFGITVLEAIDIINNQENLSPKEEERRNIVMAAFDNIIDFSVAEEYQLAEDVMKEFDEMDEDSGYDEDEMMAICARYNKTYASTENYDIEYAMMIALSLFGVDMNSTLTYMTQGDERVRPWHLAWEGYTAPKSMFPAWLVPPIEWGCRCYLVQDVMFGSVQAATRFYSQPSMPSWFNPIFKECVAFGGRIFSDEHPYFQIKEQYVDKLKEISNRIKDKYFNAKSED